MLKSTYQINARNNKMKYNDIHKGRFINRPNRFIANVEINGEIQVVHVKNTGRCKELLTDNVCVLLEKSSNPARKTLYDLVSVYKGKRLVNMDSQAPNKVFQEYLEAGKMFDNITFLKPECKFNNSRFDFYAETDNRKIFMEVKGVTLEKNNVVLFPDAPTERGLKHIYELIYAKEQGYDAYVVFVVQMSDVEYFTPNKDTHPEFADALRVAKKAGVNIIALDCIVTENTLEINKKVEVVL